MKPQDLPQATPRKEIETLIIEATCLFFGLVVDDFKKNRATDTVSTYRRHTCYYLLRKNTLLSFDKIALLFNTGKSTIQFGFEKIDGFVSIEDRRILGDIKDIQRLIDNFNEKNKAQWLSHNSSLTH